jgi:NADH-quinone oxidoreductase subunit C
MNEEIKEYVSQIQPNVTFDETGEWLNINIEANEFRPVASMLRNSTFQFDYLFCLTCVDWKTHLTVVYHLSSTRNRELNIVLKVKLDRENPEVETVCDIWRTAEFLEREVFEMYGVKFLHHPDLRKLILEDDFVGYPLRKDFEDPINMIKL